MLLDSPPAKTASGSEWLDIHSVLTKNMCLWHNVGSRRQQRAVHVQVLLFLLLRDMLPSHIALTYSFHGQISELSYRRKIKGGVKREQM